MMTAYGNWFTGAVSLAWWIVAIKSLHLLLTRRRFGRRSKANVQTIT
jgi:ribose/xylose/arabinose/galactoside ABC-type transport system permease subunit